MWTIKNIYEADYGCEERMPDEPLTVLVILESDTGEVKQVEVSDKWLTFMKLDEGDEWPEELIDQETSIQDKCIKQSEWTDNYMEAMEEYNLSGKSAENNTDITKMEYMNMAIEQARMGIHSGHGGPFGSVIVKDGKVIGVGHNMVLKNNDSTAHGEVVAIRNAEQELGTYDLSGAEIYTTGEPCPMCLAACMWANISKVYYGCTIDDNESIGFRDAKFDHLLGGRSQMADFLQQIGRKACLELFDEYNKIDKRIIY